MSERIEWDDDAAHHIRTRSLRYPDAVDSSRIGPSKPSTTQTGSSASPIPCLPASTLVRSWILAHLSSDGETPAAATVNRIAKEVEQLRRQLAS